MRRFIEDFKMKNIAFLLLFFLLVSGHTNANAVGGSIGGWRITSNVAQGIGAKITATKDVIINGASKAVTSSATVLPKAANVGKFMGKNFGAAAVIGAMDLLLDGVDYVMDPANNTVTYKRKEPPPCYDAACIPASAISGYKFAGGPFNGQIVTSLTAACTKFNTHYQNNGGAWWGTTSPSQSPPSCISANGSAMQYFGVIVNPNYDPLLRMNQNQLQFPFLMLHLKY